MTMLSSLAEDDQQNGEIDRIAARIRQLCEGGIASGRVYLLSRLGLELGEDVKRLKLLTGGANLAGFVRGHPALQSFELVPTIEAPNVLAVVKKSQSEGVSSEVAAPRPVTLPARSAFESRYHYRFWAAFSVPLQNGRRFIDPANFVFRHLEESEQPPEGWLEIEAEYIAPESAPNRDERIKENISRWLQKNGLDRSAFLHDAKTPSSPQQNLLSLMLDVLDKRQLQSTTMSLDVIAALLKKRV
jgi:hypothetical protein